MKSLRALAIPTLVYLGVTLVVPAANGAATEPDYWEHAGWVLGVCLTVVAVLGLGHHLVGTARRSYVAPEERTE